ncbi:MAG: sigma 54-interacting transcriptional regulator, partial [Phycisphaerae bacterium]|nr:sigma 54-interacting transcriptional regulator [Phycisphaerae bacterium]
ISDSMILIQGETGTGKELLARAIHGMSNRKEKPFVAINCGAIPDTLLESELFGYKKGAFTGADSDKPGRLQSAEGGTIFLDEIGEVSTAFQVRLLRVLQEKTYEPLGRARSIKANVRFIAATNRDLAAQVKKGTFREDLFYRVNVVRIDVPPLRQRREDIPLLVDHFIARFNRIQGKTIVGVDPGVLSFLMAHDFPGNVRELENILEHAFVLCLGGVIKTHHLPEEFLARIPIATGKGDMQSSMRAVESQLILETLRRNRFNRLAAARELKMHKSTLFRKIKNLRLSIPPKDRKKQDR